MSGRRWRRLWGSIVAFFLGFSLEIHVQAEGLKKTAGAPNDSEIKVLQEPDGCWLSGEKPCALKTDIGENARLKSTGQVLVLDESSAVVMTSETEFRLVSGQVWIVAVKPIGASSEFGTFSGDVGEYWFSRDADHMIGKVVRGSLELHPRGSPEILELKEGLENWLGRVGTDGRARNGVPVAIDFKSHLARWAHLFRGDKEVFTKEAKAFFTVWQTASRQAADLHETLFVSRVASLRVEHANQVAAQKKVEARNRELIEMFRQKLSGD